MSRSPGSILVHDVATVARTTRQVTEARASTAAALRSGEYRVIRLRPEDDDFEGYWLVPWEDDTNLLDVRIMDDMLPVDRKTGHDHIVDAIASIMEGRSVDDATTQRIIQEMRAISQAEDLLRLSESPEIGIMRVNLACRTSWGPTTMTDRSWRRSHLTGMHTTPSDRAYDTMPLESDYETFLPTAASVTFGNLVGRMGHLRVSPICTVHRKGEAMSSVDMLRILTDLTTEPHHRDSLDGESDAKEKVRWSWD